MGNVEILYEGPFWGSGREQIARSVTGKWFSRHWGEYGGLTKSPWREIEKPRRPWPTDKVFIGREGFPALCDWAHWYRGPTDEECENCIKGADGYLHLVPGPYKLRVPLSPEETAALRERQVLSRAATASHSARSLQATRL